MSRKHTAWVISASIALLFMATHFWFGWEAAKFEAASHDQTRQMDEYRVEWARDTTENMQSEFWQIAWQMALLAGVLAPIVVAYERDMETANTKLDRIVAHLGIDQPDEEVHG